MISAIIRDNLTQNPPIIAFNPPVSGANAANNFWKVSKNILLIDDKNFLFFKPTFKKKFGMKQFIVKSN